MDELMRVMAAKKRETALLQAQKKEKYLRRSEVETILLASTAATARESSSSKREDKSADVDRDELQSDATAATTSSQQQQQQQQQMTKKRKLDSETPATTTTTTTQQQQQSSDTSTTTYTLPWPELKKRLRELGEPIRVFGETEHMRIDRLRTAEHDAATRQEDALGDGHRTRSRFANDRRELHDAEHDAVGDAADDNDDFDDRNRPSDGSTSAASAGGGGSNVRLSTNATTTNNDAFDSDETDHDKLIYRFFKRMLTAWERDLADRPDHVKRTAQGKIATKTMKQCKDYIRPLFKLCKTRTVPSDIRSNLVAIVRFCTDNEFVLANDAYIRLAIGNAAWPIGVTMVGIHERTGREKINANKQAHVMNNEAQRKYLTSVKRLISYAQSVSSALPSKKVMA